MKIFLVVAALVVNGNILYSFPNLRFLGRKMFSFQKLFHAFTSLFTTSLLVNEPIELTHSVSSFPNCTIKWNDALPSWFPLIFNTSTSEIIYPRKTANNSDWSVIVRRNKYLNFACSTDSVKGYSDRNEIRVRCTSTGLKVDNSLVNFTQLGCVKQVKEKLTTVGSCNENKFSAVDIFFQANSTKLPLINVCHDINTDNTVFAHHYIIGAGLNPFEVSNSRPTFKEGSFYTKISANEAYSQNSQLNQVALLVGSQSLAEKYINTSRSFYFARGHLAPDGDFVHIYEQNATYYYINVIPQWQVINNGNWKALESSLRNYAKAQNVDLEIWTGGKDILKLDDVNGNPVEVYLSRDSTGKLRLPVPELTWKVIVDNVRNSSVAVFVVNNPHLQQVPTNMIVCEDICSRISWITWDTKNIQKGFTYCCDLKSVESILPNLNKNLKGTSLMT